MLPVSSPLAPSAAHRRLIRRSQNLFEVGLWLVTASERLVRAAEEIAEEIFAVHANVLNGLELGEQQ